MSSFVGITPLIEEMMRIVAPYYKDKQFCYLDLEMLHDGYQELKSHPHIMETLLQLTQNIEQSLSLTLAEKTYLKS